jgi:hypothetical protein
MELVLNKGIILIHIVDERKPHPIVTVLGCKEYHLVLRRNKGYSIGMKT